MTNQPSAEAARECPFCGGRAERRRNPLHGDNSMVHCQTCGASAYDRKWNTRAPDPRTAALVAALEPFVEAADNLEDDERDTGSLWESPEAMMLTVADLRRAKAAWATFHASNPATAQVAGEGL